MSFADPYRRPVSSAVVIDTPRPRLSHPSDRVRGVIVGATLALAGVGIYSAVTAGAGTPATPAAPAIPMTMTQRVLPPTTFPGFIETQRPSVIRNAGAWAKLEPAGSLTSTTARLRAIGFVAGVSEQLHGVRVPAEAVSTAERYRTAAGADAQLRYESNRLASMPNAAQFAVPGVPGAIGITLNENGVMAGDVLFTVGAYYYVVASGTDGTGHGVPGPASLTRAANVQYLGVEGCTTNSR
ncbi:MAG TPA: hypothetical protein VHX62_02350 [Solirubrobacteraceae bacterium]|jgi:hypothetical protein|nr:hypothetical protein [Solirubrobacteraceae bacterium]